jgi:hypothetical protein
MVDNPVTLMSPAKKASQQLLVTAGIFLSGCVLSGCVGIPPLRTAGQFGVSGSATDRQAPTVQGDMSFRPLGLFPQLGDRKVDVGVGGTIHYAARGEDARGQVTWLYGPAASIEVFPYVDEIDGGGYFRFVTGADVKTLYRPDLDAWGPFMAPKVGVEITAWDEGCGTEVSSSGIFWGCYSGEIGIGAYADGQVGVIEGNIHYSAGLSIALRTPGGLVGGIPFP